MIFHICNQTVSTGRVIGHIRVIEFQKRGLPHAHLLLILHPDDKPRTVEDYDSIVSAQIPDPDLFPTTHDCISSRMMHGPCGPNHPRAPCMENGVCSKGYPKAFVEQTHSEQSGYPVYKRPNNGVTVTTANNVQLDNRWVVPHNIYLATKYNAHINVEICTTIHVIKYLYKYVYKGHDRARNSVKNAEHATANALINEINILLDAR